MRCVLVLFVAFFLPAEVIAVSAKADGHLGYYDYCRRFLQAWVMME